VSTPEAAITISLTDLEGLIRRVVREAIREELARARTEGASILEDWAHEGPDDRVGDEELLAEALVMSEQYRKDKEGWKHWEAFKSEV